MVSCRPLARGWAQETAQLTKARLEAGIAERDAYAMVAERGGHGGGERGSGLLGEPGNALARAGVPPGRDPSCVRGYAGHTTKTT